MITIMILLFNHPVVQNMLHICSCIVQSNISCGKISIIANNTLYSKLNEGSFSVFLLNISCICTHYYPFKFRILFKQFQHDFGNVHPFTLRLRFYSVLHLLDSNNIVNCKRNVKYFGQNAYFILKIHIFVTFATKKYYFNSKFSFESEHVSRLNYTTTTNYVFP